MPDRRSPLFRNRLRAPRGAALAAAWLFAACAAAEDGGSSPLERPVCENREAYWIDQFQRIATPWLNDWRSYRPEVGDQVRIEPYRIKNEIDQRTLQVYKLSKASTDPGKVPPRRLLFIQGNAMFAGSVADHIEPFVDAGFEVHMMEFRGYGFRGLRSEGKAFLQAVVSDFRQLAGRLGAEAPFDLYGISFGGVVALNVLSQTNRVAGAAIDSAPADLSCPLDYRCDSRWWPLNNVPGDAANVIVIAGSDDPVVPTTCSDALAQAVRDRGGCAFTGARWTHPLRAERPAHREQRTQVILDFLLSRQCPKGP